jgi:ferric-dicitrate binding protein FerR (iron transport regulator)
VEDLRALLDRDAAWYPAADEATRWLRRAAEPDAPPALAVELRWWRAVEAARARDWSAVSALAEQGLAEPFSEREAIRLALLHCMSGSISEAEHVIAQAVQLGSDESLLLRFAAVCEREGLLEAAERFR